MGMTVSSRIPRGFLGNPARMEAEFAARAGMETSVAGILRGCKKQADFLTEMKTLLLWYAAVAEPRAAKENRSATSLESRSHDNEKSRTGFDIHYQRCIDSRCPSVLLYWFILYVVYYVYVFLIYVYYCAAVLA